MTAFLAVLASLAITWLASLAIERFLGRSSKEMIKPGWYVVFFLAAPALIYVVYRRVPVDSPWIYAAYGLAGGGASLIAQWFYGAKRRPRS